VPDDSTHSANAPAIGAPRRAIHLACDSHPPRMLQRNRCGADPAPHQAVSRDLQGLALPPGFDQA